MHHSCRLDKEIRNYLTEQNIRIFHECELRIEKSVRGSLIGITSDAKQWSWETEKIRSRVTDWHHEWCQTVIPRDGFFYPHQTAMIVFFLHIFWSPAFDFNIGVAINESCWRSPHWNLTSYVTSQWRQLPMSLRQSYVNSIKTNVLTSRVVIRFLSTPRVG